ncbi:MAG TPA: PAS domain S-box protein [Syntrophomonadaceae bacterium]|nr:PAS domain S-box protein [Syntrophomonadaceae bacterium]
MSRTAGYSSRQPRKRDYPVSRISELAVRTVNSSQNNSGENVWQALAREQNRIIENLRGSEEKFAQAFEMSPCAMFISRTEDGCYVDVNAAFCRLTGYSRGGLLQRPSSFLDLWRSRLQEDSIVQELVERGAFNNKEIFFHHKNGEERYALLSTQTFYWKGDPCFISAMIDISEQRRTMQEMDRRALLHLVRELASSLAHEVRNPMTTVRGFLQMMNENERYAMDRETIELMIAELDRSNAMISEFLFLTREKSLDLRLLSLNAILEEMRPFLESAALIQQKLVQFHLEDNPSFLMDEKEIKQMIRTLVQNGLEALQPGQTLRISIFRQEGETVISGQGIAGIRSTPRVVKGETDVGREFGTGLGMSVCHGIAARHHAVMEVMPDSHGMVFQVRFRI